MSDLPGQHRASRVADLTFGQRLGFVILAIAVSAAGLILVRACGMWGASTPAGVPTRSLWQAAGTGGGFGLFFGVYYLWVVGRAQSNGGRLAARPGATAVPDPHE